MNGSNANLYEVIDELKGDYPLNMGTIKQVAGNTSKSKFRPSKSTNS